jgi:hypothetical protein
MALGASPLERAPRGRRLLNLRRAPSDNNNDDDELIRN